jgi:uncharacterized protein involved in response to NO
MKITEPEQHSVPSPVWQLAFRAGFLLAGAFATLAMIRWLYWMWSPEKWDFTLFPGWWHAHEMVFGFAMPVVAGFLLTAVATWTGQPGTKGGRLQLLFGLWLVSRLVLWLQPNQLLFAWLAEMMFMGLLLYELTQRVWAVRQWRNMLFSPVILALAVLSSASYWNADNPLLSARLHYGAVWMITVLIVIVGGRVIPLFTSNRMGMPISALPSWFEALAIGSVVVVGLATTIWPWQTAAQPLTLLCLAGSAIHTVRLAHWQGWKTRSVPLLWSLHLSYLCIPLAMLGLAMVGGEPVASKSFIHLLAIGSIGGMILTMMSRVSLGHTGRPLETPGYLTAAFSMVFAAALIRAFLPLLDISLTLWAWRVSAVLWIIAFSLFLIHYVPVLTQPRVDGKPG